MVDVKKEAEEFSFDSHDKGDRQQLGFSTPVSRKRVRARRSTKGCWSEEEDSRLLEAVKKHNGKNWKKIAAYLPGKTDVQCFHHWLKVVNPELVKGSWTKEEDDCIIDQVAKYGCKRWSIIAKYLPGRIGKQCRERWHNHLDPSIKKDAWTEEEESILAFYHEIYGNKWTKIARFLPRRTDNAIKNHWNCSIKKLEASSPGCDVNAVRDFITGKMNILVKDEDQNLSLMISPNTSCRLKQNIESSLAELIPQNTCDGMTLGILNERRSIYSPEGITCIDVSHLRLAAKLDFVTIEAANTITNEVCTSSSDATFFGNVECCCPLLRRPVLATHKEEDLVEVGNKRNRVQSQDLSPAKLSTAEASASHPESMKENFFNGYYYAPLKFTGSNSPESILRSLAMTYDNIPSIIRRRTRNKRTPEVVSEGGVNSLHNLNLKQGGVMY